MIALILKLGLFGLIVYLIITYVPMHQAFKTAIIVISVIVLILYVMAALGIGDLSVPRIH